MKLRVFAVSLLTVAACAQTSAGPVLGAPIHTVVGPNTLGPGATLLSTDDLYLKRAGFTDVGSAPAYPPGEPQFTMGAMFPGAPAGFRINAISSQYCTVGVNWVPNGMGFDGVMNIPGDWGVLMFGVGKSSPGSANAAAVQTEAAAGDGPGADVFSYVLPGSVLPAALDCSPVGVAQRASDSSEMGFQTMPGQQPEIGDFDAFFSLYEARAVCGAVAPFLVDNPWVFFSLPAAVIANPGLFGYFFPWFVNGIDPPSSATILAMQWTGAGWTMPQVFLTYAQMGLDVNDDIDALSVDDSQKTLLLSLVRNGTTASNDGHQCMVDDWDWNPGPVGTLAIPQAHQAQYYYFDNGADTLELIAIYIGAENNGEIDASCDADPGNANGVAGAALGFTVACRDDLPHPSSPWPVSLNASMFVSHETAFGDCAYAASVAGLGVSGAGPHLSGLVVGFPDSSTSTVNLGLSGPVISGITVGVWVITEPNQTVYWTKPPNPFPINWVLDFQWAGFSNGAVSLANTVRLRL